MIDHEIRIWRDALDAAAKEADNFLFAEGDPRDVASRIRGLIPTPTVTPRYPLSEAVKVLYRNAENRLTLEVNASNHLSGLDSHLVVTRTDLHEIRNLLSNHNYSAALRRVSKILDGEKSERASVAKPKGPPLCGIPSRTIGSCDYLSGHAGDLHSNAGDGFYVSDSALVARHRLAQSARKKKGRAR